VVTGCHSFALLAIILLASGLLLPAAAAAFADPLQNAYRQRIGNYDVEMTTEPKSPAVGAPASILVRIAGVNGDDLIDIPIRIALAKLGGDTVQEIVRTNPIVVPYGHYTYDYTFAEQVRAVRLPQRLCLQRPDPAVHVFRQRDGSVRLPLRRSACCTGSCCGRSRGCILYEAQKASDGEPEIARRRGRYHSAAIFSLCNENKLCYYISSILAGAAAYAVVQISQ
jgi:hypothetical protein